MTVTRFIAIKLKDAYAGSDEKAKLAREEVYNKHLELYKSRPYVLSAQGALGNQTSDQGYHYAIVVEFESPEKVKYYSDEDPDHIKFKVSFVPVVENLFYWAFPPQN